MYTGIPKIPDDGSEIPVSVTPSLDVESCWSSLATESLSDYYSSSVSDLRWNFNQDYSVPNRSLDRSSDVFRDRISADNDLEQIQHSRSSAYASGTATTSSNQSASSYSSEDPPEKNNDSGTGGLKSMTATSNKVKKKVQQRVRQPRFAFMTKSEVDHLEDGYRWRKYGQKAVKNSPFPRSYYRCTHNKCTVKKRVERSFEDPTTVITTYEGQHCHHTMGFPRGGFMKYENVFSTQFSLPPPRFYYPGTKLNTGQDDDSISTTQPYGQLQARDEVTHENSGVLPICDHSSGQIHMDQGLLEDIVSPRPRDS